MPKNLTSKLKLAELAGVSPSTMTGLVKKRLKPAIVGKQLDLDHPVVLEYLAERERKQTVPDPVAPGIDPVYPDAVEFARGLQRPSADAIKKHFRISTARAASVFKLIKDSGVLSDAMDKKPASKAKADSSEGNAARVVSGNEKARVTKKDEALKKLAARTPDDEGEEIHEVPEDILAFADMTLRDLIRRFGSDAAFVDWLKATKEIENINGLRIKNAELEGKLVSRDLVQRGVIDVFNGAFLRLMTDGAKTIAAETAMKAKAGASVPEVEAHVSELLGNFIKPVKNKVSRTLKNA